MHCGEARAFDGSAYHMPLARCVRSNSSSSSKIYNFSFSFRWWSLRSSSRIHFVTPCNDHISTSIHCKRKLMQKCNCNGAFCMFDFPIDRFIDKFCGECVVWRCAANSGLLHIHLLSEKWRTWNISHESQYERRGVFECHVMWFNAHLPCLRSVRSVNARNCMRALLDTSYHNLFFFLLLS